MTSAVTDFYRQRLAHAKWTWMEFKHFRCKHFVGNPGRKLRAEGRTEKRRARHQEREEIERDVAMMDVAADAMTAYALGELDDFNPEEWQWWYEYRFGPLEWANDDEW